MRVILYGTDYTNIFSNVFFRGSSAYNFCSLKHCQTNDTLSTYYGINNGRVYEMLNDFMEIEQLRSDGIIGKGRGLLKQFYKNYDELEDLDYHRFYSMVSHNKMKMIKGYGQTY